MADVDELARRTTSLVTDLARKGIVLATWFAMIVFLVAGLSYLTGLAGLEGSARSAWMVVGGVMLVIAVGAPLLARWRLSAVRRHASDIVGELRTLIARDGNAQRVVIETIAVEEHDPSEVRDLRPVVYDSRQFSRLRQVTVTATDLRALPGVLRTVTTFPALLAIGLVGILVFGTLGFLFLIAWIF
jgi:hypothetical protein